MIEIAEVYCNNHKVCSLKCPYCEKKINFVNLSPIRCMFCGKELPNFISLMTNKNVRRLYFFVGIEGLL